MYQVCEFNRDQKLRNTVRKLFYMISMVFCSVSLVLVR